MSTAGEARGHTCPGREPTAASRRTRGGCSPSCGAGPKSCLCIGRTGSNPSEQFVGAACGRGRVATNHLEWQPPASRARRELLAVRTRAHVSRCSRPGGGERVRPQARARGPFPRRSCNCWMSEPHGWQGQDKRRAGNWNGGSWGPQPGARAPSAVPLNKAAMGPKMPGYYNDASQMGMGPTGRNDGVLYGRNEQSNWSVQGQMGMHGGPRMQGMPSLRPPSIGDGLVEGLEGLQVGGDGGMMRGQRKPSNGERQEETDDDMFAMFRFKVCCLP